MLLGYEGSDHPQQELKFLCCHPQQLLEPILISQLLYGKHKHVVSTWINSHRLFNYSKQKQSRNISLTSRGTRGQLCYNLRPSEMYSLPPAAAAEQTIRAARVVVPRNFSSIFVCFSFSVFRCRSVHIQLERQAACWPPPRGSLFLTENSSLARELLSHASSCIISCFASRVRFVVKRCLYWRPDQQTDLLKWVFAKRWKTMKFFLWSFTWSTEWLNYELFIEYRRADHRSALSCLLHIVTVESKNKTIEYRTLRTDVIATDIFLWHWNTNIKLFY